MDDGGQSALFDAFLFFVIALVASATALSYASLSFAIDETAARGEALSYSEEVRLALMRTTLQDPWYRTSEGVRVDLGQGITIERFLLDEVRLVAAGLDVSHFEDTNGAIRKIADSLVRPPFSVGISAALFGTGSAVDLWIGNGSGPPTDRFSADWDYVAGDGSSVNIAIHLWYA